MGDGNRRTDDLHPVVRGDLPVPFGIHGSWWELGLLFEEPFHARRCEHHQDRGIFTAQVLKAMRAAAGNKDERSLGSVEHRLVRQESEVTFQNEPHLVFASVHVLGRTILGRNGDLREGKRTAGGGRSGFDGCRSSGRTPEGFATASSYHDGTRRSSQSNSILLLATVAMAAVGFYVRSCR